MCVNELNWEQRCQLKTNYLMEQRGEEGVFYGEIIEIDKLVTDAEIDEHYAGVSFVEDDFF